MKKLLSLMALGLALSCSSAFAASHAGAPMKAGGCDAKAAEKKLSGAAKTSFVTKCEKDTVGDAAATCDKAAADKKLSGAAKTSFTKKCVGDAAAAAGGDAAAMCDKSAADKKLSGAAKASHVKKCVADAGKPVAAAAPAAVATAKK